MVIAIDGPGGSGKSTLAASLAARLGVERLDTGAMYRAVALAALRAGVAPGDAGAVAELAGRVDMEVHGSLVRLDGEDVSEAIRTPEVTAAASAVAVHPAVRAELVARQRAWVKARPGAVVEGRDIGSVVCPDADLKVYLTADAGERARRRALEMEEPGDVAADLAMRDRTDETRTASPLDVAPDAVVLDTTGLTLEAVLEQVLGLLAAKTSGTPRPEPAADPVTAHRPRRPPPRLVPPTLPARSFYALARTVLYWTARLLWQVTIEGTERVPARGPFIVSPVHRSNIDTILMAAVTRRRLCYLAKDSLWRWRPLGWLFSALGGFPVRRGMADREALRRAVEVLRSGQALVVFPEGTRRSGPVVQEIFEGAAYLSLRTGAPIVPVGIGGSEGAMPRGARLPARVKIHMIVGEPLVPGGQETPPSRVPRHEIRLLTERLHHELQVVFDRAQAMSGPHPPPALDSGPGRPHTGRVGSGQPPAQRPQGGEEHG